MMKEHFPPGWDEERVARVLSHYETQTDEEALAEDEAAFKGKKRTVVEVPVELMPVIREILAQYKASARADVADASHPPWSRGAPRLAGDD